MMSKSPGLLTVWALLLAIFVPTLFQEGMFLDGVSYAAIARNLANGNGDFCHLHYTNTLYPVLREHPPLAMWCQSWFFIVLGDHLWVERLYAMLMAGLSAWGIMLNWKLFAPAHWHRLVWLPVLCWLSIPVVIWSYQNNMLENTMTVLVLAATYSLGKAASSKRLIWALLGSGLVLAAVLSKGPVGLFPLAVPLLMGIFRKEQSILMGLGWSVFVTAGFVAAGFCLWWLLPCIQEVIQGYLKTQLLPAMETGREVPVGNRLQLIWVLIQPLLPLCLAVGLGWGWMRRSHKPMASFSKSFTWFFLGLAFCGSLPIMLSLKQSAHYLAPSMPYFAMFFAALMVEMLELPTFHPKFSNKQCIRARALVVILLIAIAISTGITDRDRSLIADIQQVKSITGPNQTIAATDALAGNWLVVAYFSRIGNISLYGSGEQEYYLCGAQQPEPEKAYVEVKTSLQGFRLYRKMSANDGI